MAYKNIKSSRFPNSPLILLALTLFICTGCGSDAISANDKLASQTVSSDRTTLTPVMLASHLSLTAGLDRLQIGQNPGACLVGGFGKPAKATPIFELPPNFDDGFEAVGWESATRTVSVVSKDSAVVLAIDMTTEADEERVQLIETSYRNQYGTPSTTIRTDLVVYLFWQDGPVRLMHCQYQGEDGKYQVTSALGLNALMDALRMEPELAQQDTASATTLITRLRANGATNGPAPSSE